MGYVSYPFNGVSSKSHGKFYSHSDFEVSKHGLGEISCGTVAIYNTVVVEECEQHNETECWSDTA